MRRSLRARAESWPLRRPFAIARGVKTTAEVVVVEVEADGCVGRGECVPYARYGETVDGVIDVLNGLAEPVGAGLDAGDLQPSSSSTPIRQ